MPNFYAASGERVIGFATREEADAFLFDEDGYFLIESAKDLEQLKLEELVFLWNASGEDEVQTFKSRREAAERVFTAMTALSEKPAKKPRAKKAAAENSEPKVRRPRNSYTGKIVLLTEENPRRAGTQKHANFELLRKLSGQKTGTAERAIAEGVPTGELNKSIKRGWIRLEPTGDAA